MTIVHPTAKAGATFHALAVLVSFGLIELLQLLAT
jgi:hypothetical protein